MLGILHILASIYEFLVNEYKRLDWEFLRHLVSYDERLR